MPQSCPSQVQLSLDLPENTSLGYLRRHLRLQAELYSEDIDWHLEQLSGAGARLTLSSPSSHSLRGLVRWCEQGGPPMSRLRVGDVQWNDTNDALLGFWKTALEVNGNARDARAADEGLWKS